jgi:DNA-binding NtrC family response regulator
MGDSLCRALERSGYECRSFTSGVAALEALQKSSADAVVTDRRMPGMDGLELLRRLRELYPAMPVILVTAYADVATAVEAMRAGAFDYVVKPFDNDEIRTLVARALAVRRLERENAWLRQESGARYTPEAMIAESAASRELMDLVRRVAPASATVLVQGESGTGKEFVARLLHYWSDRVSAPFVAVNCAALAEGVLESELFGHEKGAFTGAVRARAGCFERADGGTLFLDEIGEVSGEFQAKLLRVLQEGEVQRVGASAARKVDVRVVAASNRNLRERISSGRFREDLFFRLNVIPIELVPLRDRPEDIVPLARFFVARHAEREAELGPEAEERLLAHGWPGNVRELENAVERALVLSRDREIGAADLLLDSGPGPARSPTGGTLQQVVDRATEERVREALEVAGGRRAEAASALGIERTTLYRLMKRFEID